jgi:hypothetical protein
MQVVSFRRRMHDRDRGRRHRIGTQIRGIGLVQQCGPAVHVAGRSRAI